MKFICMLAACVTAALLTGCGTIQRIDDIDAGKVSAINRAAAGRGVEVHWLNYPQRKVPNPTGEPPTPTTQI